MVAGGAASRLPVSVVVPVRDEGGTVDALLHSLLEQSRPPGEIVVVDAGSGDDTAERVRRWGDRYPAIRLVQTGPAHPGEARNAGIAAAAHTWVALTDAGIRVDRDWLAELWAAREATPEAEVVFGHYEPALRGWLAECAALTYVAPCVWEAGQPWRGESFASVLLQRQVWERCGGFPPFRAAEDLIFLETVRSAGCRIAAAPSARVSWEIPADVPGTWRRFASYSRHNLIAGRARHWHRGVARLWLGAALISAAGVAIAPVWWSLLPLAAAARAGRSIAHRRFGSGVVQPWRPDRLAGVAGLHLLLDLATLWGTLVWLRHDWGRGRRQASRVAGHGSRVTSREQPGETPQGSPAHLSVRLATRDP
jgi:cellulose synthase/poly-beta-1,6-N-acetylglucosamine synthase-like glycosyltransferase